MFYWVYNSYYSVCPIANTLETVNKLLIAGIQFVSTIALILTKLNHFAVLNL